MLPQMKRRFAIVSTYKGDLWFYADKELATAFSMYGEVTPLEVKEKWALKIDGRFDANEVVRFAMDMADGVFDPEELIAAYANRSSEGESTSELVGISDFWGEDSEDQTDL